MRSLEVEDVRIGLWYAWRMSASIMSCRRALDKHHGTTINLFP